MPNFTDRSQQNTIEELQEFSNTGPFGGVQSEVPLDQVEQFGQTDVLNMMLRKSIAETRSGYMTLPALPAPSNEDIVGMADFYTTNGVRLQVIMTLTRLLLWNNSTQAWTNVPNTVAPLAGGTLNLFTWTVVDNRLCFCQGVDNLQGWDGINGVFSPLNLTSAYPAKFLMELDTHLVTAYTIERAIPKTQRVRWSGSGDPTDYTSPSSGINDILGDLGPITGCAKIFQSGYIWSQWGITQMIPTGIGTNPFDFVPLTTRARGNTIPYSLATAGEEYACYVGKDNVYIFNGTDSTPIGDHPIQGNKRLGARSRIFADLGLVNQQTVTGYVSDTINGQVFPAYWLVIPGVSVWIYQLDEQSWMRFTFANIISIIGRFFRGGTVRWVDLIGSWAQQSFTWSLLPAFNPNDAVALGFDNGVIGNIDFSETSEQNWSMSGVFVMGDVRHSKTIKKFRISILDNGPVTFTVTLSNQAGNIVSETVTMGNGSGFNISQVLAPKNTAGFSGITGIRINWQISGLAGQDLTIVEFAPMFKTAGEQRGGTVDY